ncbi:hypothetical protein AXG93_4242s1270 [Marchantia polymorpha subsp. ruderalis]|nr:hypothetical protein AXG93_4242s1270 [Marchantia polymorpha subsp. ruderalis]
MELRYAGFVSLLVILSFVVSGTTARLIPGSTGDTAAVTTADLTTTKSSELDVPMPPGTVVNDFEGSHRGAAVTDNPTEMKFGEVDVTHEERMLVASTMDYEGPTNNENPKHNP